MIWNPALAMERLAPDKGPTLASMEGVCIGFRPGSSALTMARATGTSNTAIVGSLVNPADPAGWHVLPVHEDVANLRRARLIDVWRDGDIIHVWSLFQDSSSMPGRAEREAVHEYSLSATADAATGQLLTLDVRPGTLPHGECPAAMANIPVLVGTPMAALRTTVIQRLRRTAGCTHLNDMLRSLAEVPMLAERIGD
jgi:hypothetical protein